MSLASTTVWNGLAARVAEADGRFPSVGSPTRTALEEASAVGRNVVWLVERLAKTKQ